MTHDANLRYHAFSIVSVILVAKQAQALRPRPDRQVINDPSISVSHEDGCALVPQDHCSRPTFIRCLSIIGFDPPYLEGPAGSRSNRD